MTEQKSSAPPPALAVCVLTPLGSPHRAAVKRTGRLTSKSPKSSNSNVTPPKATSATPNATKEEARRRRNPVSDMLKHRNGITPDSNQPVSDVEDAMLELSPELAKIRSNAENAPTTDDIRNPWESTINDAVQRESEELVRQNHELRCRVAQMEEQLFPDRTRQGTERPKAPEEVSDLRQRLHVAEKESQERLQQLISLKSSISSLTRVQSQVTDGDLMSSFSELANRVREWTVSNLRRTKLNFDNLPKETEDTIHALYPQYRNGIQGADKFALYQAVVSNSLMDIFQIPLVFGLPASLAAIQTFASQVQDGGAAYCDWKRATIQVLESSSVQKDIAKERERLLHRILGDICHLLFTLTSTTVTSSAQTALHGILKSTVELQQTLALQKSRYELLFFRSPGAPMHLDDRTMEAINDVDSTTDDDSAMETDRTFLFCAFPGLVKHGDEWGEHLEMSNVLLKARVCSGFG
ncbi:hypothetical protein yc1106_08188 [Curvularia clavata]|uniref:Uncharacterized protein n=1 Tax=Curvularia clavata TaxID=95742 RepID=A0A9Q8ZG93_CURCL|nr:hypothetical protein yc1106_08188 [Curvularia clavata]